MTYTPEFQRAALKALEEILGERGVLDDIIERKYEYESEHTALIGHFARTAGSTVEKFLASTTYAQADAHERSNGLLVLTTEDTELTREALRRAARA